ncbi:MAG TPA: ABC transporter permease subunit, partial [Anaerolineales bacterium]|nr:ABC transporter permease subunit [Anaerolineales bacterium]
MASIAESVSLPRSKSRSTVLDVAAGRILSAILTLLVIAFLAYWGLTMASRAVEGLPADPVGSAAAAVELTVNHFIDHPSTYFVHKEDVPAFVHIGTLLRNSLGLLLPALAIAFAVGVPLGMAAARRHTRGASSLIWLISIIGISVPAFMLAMFLWVINLEVAKQFDLTPLPATGLGWDRHILLPALVLAARPFAQLTQVTYVTITGLFEQDFVRTARGKGVPQQHIDRRHILRNAWIPILTSLSTSLRFALATLPVVEFFFVWPGIGLGLLDAIIAGEMAMAVDMVLVLGLVFLVVNTGLEIAYPLLDPRLDGSRTREQRQQAGLRRALAEWIGRVGAEWRERREARRPGKAGEVGAASDVAPAVSRRWRPVPLHGQLAALPAISRDVAHELRAQVTEAKASLGRGDLARARRSARQAVRLDPSSEAAWLTLAAVSDPRSAQAYAARALEINPRSDPAHRAIRWAAGEIPKREPQPVVRAGEAPAYLASAPPRPKPVRLANGTLSAPGEAAGGRRGWAILTDPVLLAAAVLAGGLLILVLFGGQMTEASPYVAHGVMMIEGKIGAPPYPPSTTFPWGTDYIGRDMQALVLYGARQTLTLALLVVAARLVIGILGGMIAGWWHGGVFDRLVMWTLSVWAAFPITLFAMILILAIGIEKGMPTFVLALCFVGWGEIAQSVRSEVIALRGKPYLEGARAVGVPPEGILRQHILPNLAPSLLVLAALEMGAVLLLLAELGFLGIFLGGGYRVMIGEVGRMVPVIAHYSDVPEWSALLANIRQWWRSYPWLAWSPAIAFSVAILTFNLWGEALRRFLERSRVSPARWINRTSAIGLAVVFGGAIWIFNTTAALGEYRSQAKLFNVDRVLADIQELSSPIYGGRETGTPGALLAAHYIAAQMEDIGLFRGGELGDNKLETYFFEQVAPRLHLTGLPSMSIRWDGGAAEALEYREDFAEYPLGNPPGSPYGRPAGGVSEVLQGRVIGLAPGPPPEGADAIPTVGSWSAGDPYGLSRLGLEQNILLIRESFVPYLPGGESAGILVVPDSPDRLQHRYLYPGLQSLRPGRRPVGAMMMIDPAIADRLLAASGTSLEDLDRQAQQLAPGESYLTAPGPEVSFEIPVKMGPGLDEKYISVIGYIPGAGAEVGLDDDVILVSAHYDGVGTAPD